MAPITPRATEHSAAPMVRPESLDFPAAPQPVAVSAARLALAAPSSALRFHSRKRPSSSTAKRRPTTNGSLSTIRRMKSPPRLDKPASRFQEAAWASPQGGRHPAESEGAIQSGLPAQASAQAVVDWAALPAEALVPPAAASAQATAGLIRLPDRTARRIIPIQIQAPIQTQVRPVLAQIRINRIPF